MKRTTLVYVHGFRSSGANSVKATQLRAHLATQRPGSTDWELLCPELPSSPASAIGVVQDIVRTSLLAKRVCLIGSSLGGFYSTVVLERLVRYPKSHVTRSVVLNPGVFPARDLAPYVDTPQTMYHDSSTPFKFSPKDHAELVELEKEMAGYERNGLKGDYLLIACTGDETLDWREMEGRYRDKRVRIVIGSDHGISDFAAYLSLVEKFAFE